MTTLVSIAQGGTGANNATQARLNLGITPASTLNVSANGGTTKLTETLNFINTASVTINVSNAASTTNVSFDAVVGLFGFVRDSFVGNGTEVNFTLSGAPLNEDNALVFVDRILQRNSEYNVSATTLTFTGAPDNGSVIDVFGTQYMSGNAAVLRTGDTMTGELNVSAKLITQNIEPAANITYDLGTNTKRFKDLWLSNSTIYLGDVQISANAGKLVVPAVETSSGINLESQVANSYAQANAAYNAANTKVNATGGSITGDLSITGNLTVQGNATTINVSNLSVNDSIMLLAANGTGDSLDIGFIGHIQRGATDTHVGLIRKAVENQFYLFDNYEVEPTNNIINVSGNNFRLANLKLGIANANTFVTSAGLDVTGQANAAYGAANNRVLKAGDTMTGQLNISSGGLLVTGSVGIGTTNPATTLHVDASGGGIVRVSRLGAGAGILQLEADGTDGAISTTNVMRFQTNSVERMRIDTAGAVCIGTNSNTSRGGSNAKLLTYKSSGTNYFDIQCGTSGDSGLLFSSSSSSAYGLINYSNSLNDMLFYTNSAERMRILSGGNVGIGTTNPSHKLHVDGNVFASANVLSVAFHAGGRSSPYTSISETSSGAMSVFAHNASGSTGSANVIKAQNTGYHSHFIRMYYDQGIAFHTSSGTRTAGDILYDFGTPANVVSGTAERMRIDISGNVGIGTTNPITKLQVNGNIYANGTPVQVQYTSSGTRVSVDSTSFTEPSSNYRVSITPKSTASMIKLTYFIPMNPGNNYATNTIFSLRAFRIIGGSTSYALTSAGSSNGSRNVFAGLTIRPVGYDSNDPMFATFTVIDFPNTTSTCTYGFDFKRETGGGGVVYFGYSAGDSSNWGFDTDVLIIAEEIGQ
jgi:hypothetical protein